MQSREIELIIKSLKWVAAGRPSPDPKAIAADPAGPNRLDWPKIIRISREHRVFGFVAFSLEQNGVFEFIDPNIRTLLTEAILRSEWENHSKLSEFKEISLLFSEKRIPVIPLKGIDLSLRIYSEIPFRQMSDVDVLVRESDLAEASGHLLALGFRLKKTPTKNLWHDRFNLKEDVPLQKIRNGRASFEKNGLDLDLHWNPRHRIGGYDIGIDLESLWSRSEPDPALGKNVRILSLEDLSWHLILHTAEMHNPNLVQLLDLAMILNRLGSRSQANVLNPSLMSLPDSSREKVQALLKDVQRFFGKENPGSDTEQKKERIISFFLKQENLGPYRKEWIHEGDLSQELRSPVKRIRYLLGYFLPNPDYYTNHKGPSMIVKHWRGLAEKTLKFIFKT